MSESKKDDFEDFNINIQYISKGLTDENTLITRCQSTIYLATQCMISDFRVRMWSDRKMEKLLCALYDAPKYQSLGICTSMVMLILSQNIKNEDVDMEFLHLLVNLLKNEVIHKNELSNSQSLTLKQEVRQLCGKLQNQNQAIHLNLDNLTIKELCMEVLLNLPSDCYSAWFKGILRECGILEQIVEVVDMYSLHVSNNRVKSSYSIMNLLLRNLKLLGNVSKDAKNQQYLLKHKDGMLIDSLIKICQVCDIEIPTSSFINDDSPTTMLLKSLIVSLNILVCLTHDYGFEFSAQGTILTEKRLGFIDVCLRFLLQVPAHIPDEEKLNLIFLELFLLTNLVESNMYNRKILFEAKIQSCPDHFLLVLILEDAHSNMLHSLIAGHVGILLGYIMKGCKEYEMYVCQRWHENNFKKIIIILEKVFKFLDISSAVIDSGDIINHVSYTMTYFKKLNIAITNAEMDPITSS
ncbi:protein wings apart-like isoform X2 [Periplaneta americana]|uniref:protein wings apart-like isoform X2 n=1 Tax=Periplaneta americana TaxID=6978 RepID=UPI0037E8FAF9